MSNVLNVPEVVSNFNAYHNGNMLIGVANSITLPTFDPEMETISGAGVLGSYDTAIPGHFGSIAQEVVFRTLDEDIFSIMNPMEPVELTFRAAEQMTAKETGALDYRSMRIVERGRLKSFTPGTMELGKQMNSSVSLELSYILIETDGEERLAYDKLNMVFRINGKDVLEKVREYI